VPEELQKFVNVQLSRTEIMVGVTRDTANAMVASQRAKTMWPVIAVCVMIVAVTWLAVSSQADWKVVLCVALMTTGVGVPTILRLLGKHIAAG